MTNTHHPYLPLLFLAVLWTTVVGFGPNTGLSLCAWGVMSAALILLWRPGEFPALLFIAFYQWVQVVVKLVQANIAGLPVNQLAQFSGDLEAAIYIGLIALLMLVLGLRAGVGAAARGMGGRLRTQALAKPLSFWFRIYLLSQGVAVASVAVAGMVPALSQPFLALAQLKWASFLMLSYAAFLLPRNQRLPWLAAFLLELGLGLGAYFSEFKTVFFFTLLALGAVGIRLTVLRVLVLMLLTSTMLLMAVVWSVVKADYRDYLSGGEKAQIVTVGYEERFLKLVDLVDSLDTRSLENGFYILLSRISYVDFLSNTLVNVPRNVPHTDGALWLDAIARPFMPRVLFPEKTSLDDSERTNRYSGVRVSGVEAGTSISIGYVGEAYIDFGGWLMMLAVWAYGWFLGALYRWLAYNSTVRGLTGSALATAIAMGGLLFESSISKVLGGLVVGALVTWLVLRLVVPRFLSALRTDLP